MSGITMRRIVVGHAQPTKGLAVIMLQMANMYEDDNPKPIDPPINPDIIYTAPI